MSEAYRTFFGLQREPFSADISLREILVTPTIKAVTERIQYAIRLGAVALITGEIGSGKSTALRHVTGNLHPSKYRVIYVTATSGSILELYRQIIDEMGVDVSSNSRAILTKTIKQEVLELSQGKKMKVVLVIEPGFTAILHTHARTLTYHPHIHVLMPGASIDKKAALWKKKGAKYLFSHKALATVFRAKLLQSIVNKGLLVPKDCPKQWVVDCKSVGNGSKAIIYLGKYLYRGVIREKDILSCKDGMVTFRYLHAKSGKYRTRTVSGPKFLYLLMLHVLPKGFRRARCYGFLHPCSKGLIKFLQLLLRVSPLTIIPPQQTQRPSISCPVCGAKMRIVATRLTKPPSARQPVLCCN